MNTFHAAYGGKGFSQRTIPHREEVGSIWGSCGISTEWGCLKTVLLHSPGPEIDSLIDPNSVQMIKVLEPNRARNQHLALSNFYSQKGVARAHISPDIIPSPNLMFQADLFL